MKAHKTQWISYAFFLAAVLIYGMIGRFLVTDYLANRLAISDGSRLPVDYALLMLLQYGFIFLVLMIPSSRRIDRIIQALLALIVLWFSPSVLSFIYMNTFYADASSELYLFHQRIFAHHIYPSMPFLVIGEFAILVKDKISYRWLKYVLLFAGVLFFLGMRLERLNVPETQIWEKYVQTVGTYFTSLSYSLSISLGLWFSALTFSSQKMKALMSVAVLGTLALYAILFVNIGTAMTSKYTFTYECYTVYVPVIMMLAVSHLMPFLGYMNLRISKPKQNAKGYTV